MSISIITKSDTPPQFERKLHDAHQDLPRFRAHRHCGVLRPRVEPEAYQQQLREEWRERSR